MQTIFLPRSFLPTLIVQQLTYQCKVKTVCNSIETLLLCRVFVWAEIKYYIVYEEIIFVIDIFFKKIFRFAFQTIDYVIWRTIVEIIPTKVYNCAKLEAAAKALRMKPISGILLKKKMKVFFTMPTIKKLIGFVVVVINY